MSHSAFIMKVSFCYYISTIQHFVLSTFFYYSIFFCQSFIPFDILSVDVFYRQYFLLQHFVGESNSSSLSDRPLLHRLLSSLLIGSLLPAPPPLEGLHMQVTVEGRGQSSSSRWRCWTAATSSSWACKVHNSLACMSRILRLLWLTWASNTHP